METIANPTTLCSSISYNIRVDHIRRRIARCPKQEGVELSAEYLRTHGADVFNHQHFALALEDMKLDQKPHICRMCHPGYRDNKNQWQTTQWSVNDFKNLKIDTTPAAICDYIFSDVCNMTCMYCDAYHSNQWAKLTNDPQPINQEWDSAAEDCLIDYLDRYIINQVPQFRIQMLGGEPLLNWNKLEKFLLRITKVFEHTDTKLTIAIISNLNVLQKNVENFIKFSEQHDIQTGIQGSIDTIGDTAENIRTGLNFDLFVSNMDLFVSNPNIMCSINASVNMLSISTMPQHYEYWTNYAIKNNRILGSDFLFGNNIVTFPRSMSPTLLPHSYTKYIQSSKKVLTDNWNGETQLLKNIIKRLDLLEYHIGTERTPENLYQARKFYTDQGLLKGIDYFDMFPELGSIL